MLNQYNSRGAVMKKLWILMAGLFFVGCAGGQQYTVKNTDGSYYRVSDIGHSNLSRKGAQYSIFELCSEGGQCQKVAEDTAVNPTLFEQLGGPAATVGAAKLLADGIEDSGDNVTNNNNAEGGAGGAGGTGGAGGAGGAG
jgi:hypothetical protein